MKRISYKGEKVSIGIDVHKNHYTVCCMVKSLVVQKVTMPALPKKLLEFLNSRFEGAEIQTAYEAGFSGFNLHRVLVAGGISNLIVNAGSIEVSTRDRVKTDRRDSLKLASLLECGRLRGIRIPSIEEEQNRLLHRTREQLIKDRARQINRLKMRLYQFGMDLPGRTSSKAFDEILAQKDISFEVSYSLRKYISLWKSINNDINEIDNILKKRSELDPLFKIYNSIPGFGVLTSSILSTELGNMSQFQNERALFNYLGLTPTERSSGDKEIKGHISRQGSARIRGVLVEAAWAAINSDQYWKHEYQRRVFKLGGKRAVVSIARRLVGVARALAKSNNLYQQKPLQGEVA
jgi:transposase